MKRAIVILVFSLAGWSASSAARADCFDIVNLMIEAPAGGSNPAGVMRSLARGIPSAHYTAHPRRRG